MATNRRRKRDELPPNVTFTLNGKDWYDCTDKERDAWRDHVTKTALNVVLGPLEEKHGPMRVAAALRAFMFQWKAEKAGHMEPILTPLMEKGCWPFTIGRVLEVVLNAADGAEHDDQVDIEPPRYAI